MAKDAYHETVKRALIKDGWRITHNPFIIEFEDLRLFADLGAEKTSNDGDSKIVIEIKVFGGKSTTTEFQKAIGQYDLYQIFMEELEVERNLFLAVSKQVYETFFQLASTRIVIARKKIKLLVINVELEEIEIWIN